MTLDARRVTCALALLPVVLFADAAAGRVVFYERDILAYWVPAMEAFVRAVAEGAWPLWDPLVNFGRPMLADPNFQFAYPPTWLNLLMAPGVYYTLFVLAHCAWAGIGAFRLALGWGLGLAGAACSGALWMLSGPFLSLVSLFHHFASAAWIAWVLLALERLLARPSRRSAGWLALAAAGMALAGSADVCVMTAVAALARVALGLVDRERPRLVTVRFGGALAASIVVAALVASVQWLPTLAYVALGSRGSMPVGANMFWSAHPATLLDAAFPGLVAGMPLGPGWRLAVFEGRGPLLRSLYLGLPALALAVLGLAGSWRMRWLAAFLAAVFLLAGLGQHTPFYPAVGGLPVIRLLRFPAKMLVPAALFVSLLAGAGLNDLVAPDWSVRRRRRVVACALGVALAGVAASCAAAAAVRLADAVGPHLATDATDVAGRFRSVLGRTGLVALVTAAALLIRAARRAPGALVVTVAAAVALVDLMTAGRDAVRLAPAPLLRDRPPLLAAFPQPERNRLYSFDYPLAWLNAQFTRVPAGWDPEWAWALGSTEYLSPPSGARWRISGSFDGDFTGLTPVPLSRLIAAAHQLRGDASGLRLLRMASVTDVVALEDSVFGLAPRFEALSVYTRPVRVFALPETLPRAYVVSGVRMDGTPEAPSLVLSPGFDSRREVALDPSSGRPPSPAVDDAGAAEIVARRSDRLSVAVAARRPAVLVVTESYDPGWRAWVDGRPAPVWRANAVFRGVPVPAGDHRVEMRYRPPSAGWGAAASVLGVVLAGVLMGRRDA